MKLTVVVPTYNRRELLRRALPGLLEQTLAPQAYEIVVVDDGSTDSTPDIIAEIGAPPTRLRYFRQENKGPAAARNYGAREAKGEIILFTGDDCLPDRDLLKTHVQAQDVEGDVGVIGHVAWDPKLDITPFMSFLEKGTQFGFGNIENPEDAPYWAFYTSNCSIRKHWLEEVGGFDEHFPAAALEDTEFAYRLHLRGVKFVYRPGAVTYHHHATTLDRYLTRQRLVGQAAVTFWRKHPELEQPLGIYHAARPEGVEQFYQALIAYAYSVGIWEATHQQAPESEYDLAVLQHDPKLLASGKAWIDAVLGDTDPTRHELVRLRREVRELHRIREEQHQEWKRVTSRRLYRWSESVATTLWRILRGVGYLRRPRSK